MRIFVVASDVPRDVDRPGTSAVNVVVSEMIRELSSLGHNVTLQLIFNVHRTRELLDADESDDLNHHRRLGIRVLPAVFPTAYARRSLPDLRSRAWRLVRLGMRRPHLPSVYPAVVLRRLMTERVRLAQADIVLTIWSPEGVAACSELEVPTVAYQGDVDFEPGLWRYRDRDLFGQSARPIGAGSWPQRLRELIWLEEFRQAHLRLMRGVSIIANVTASNAEFYARHGHPRSIYARNLWRRSRSRTAVPPVAAEVPLRIVGHAGRLDATGSVYGLRYLMLQLLPELEREMQGMDYQVHVIGGGRLPEPLVPYATHPRIVLRGFVDNLDAELETAVAYLLLNNSGPYRAAFTRHLVAWSLGACMIVHANSRDAIPEIEDRYNALVGARPDEIARLVRMAVTNPELNGRVRTGGRETYERWFTPERVVSDLAREMQAISS